MHDSRSPLTKKLRSNHSSSRKELESEMSPASYIHPKKPGQESGVKSQGSLFWRRRSPFPPRPFQSTRRSLTHCLKDEARHLALANSLIDPSNQKRTESPAAFDRRLPGSPSLPKSKRLEELVVSCFKTAPLTGFLHRLCSHLIFVNVSSMANLNHLYDKTLTLNFVEDSVVAHSDSVASLAP